MRTGSFRVPKEHKVFPDYGPGHCRYCGEPVGYRRKFYCSDKHRDRYYLESATYYTVSWASFRLKIIERDGNRCHDCGGFFEDPSELNVHHQIPISQGGEEFDKDNLVTLCRTCHKRRHRKRFRGRFPGNSIDMSLDVFCKPDLVDKGVVEE